MNALRLLPALLLALAACLAPAGAAEPGANDRLVMGQLSPCTTLDPARVVDADSIQVVRAVFEGLVRLRDGGLDVEPCLAESWEADPAALQWTFTLRPDLRFHDGTPCNAEAVVFSFLRIMDPAHPHFAGPRGNLPMPLGNVSAVEALDQLRVRFTLKSPHAGFLQGLSLPQLSVVSPAAVAGSGNGFARRPVGAGPFAFGDWTADGTVTVRANPDYWGPKPRIKEVIFRPVVNDAQRFHEFASGALDVVAGVPPADVARMAHMSEARLHSLPGLAVSYLGMRLGRPPLDRPEVRRAVAHAINTEALVRLIYQGQADSARGILPPGAPGFDPALRGHAYDPVLARRLLAGAGLAKGFSVTLLTMNAPRPYLPNPVRVAEAVKGNLEAVGIRTRIASQDFPSFLDGFNRDEYDMFLLGWVMDTPDPDDLLSSLAVGSSAAPGISRGVWNSNRAMELLAQARQETDTDRRATLYSRFQELLRDEAPLVPLAHPRMNLAVRSRVQGLVLQPTGDVRFNEAWKK
ncbi:MAG: ABC transporter substrate-binding protein [Thermodesulfobacteriota bacterium]